MNLHFSGYSEVVLPLNGPVMRIEQVKDSDAGSYSCHVGNGLGQDLVANFIISVKGTTNSPIYFVPLVFPASGSLLNIQSK